MLKAKQDGQDLLLRKDDEVSKIVIPLLGFN